MKMIDLRSDTFTLPTVEMRKVIANAPVGDDVFGEDPSVNELQQYIADLLGKEDAIYVPSGTMANQISIAVMTNPGEEVIVESNAHIFYYEAAAPSVISRVQLRCLDSDNGMIEPKKIIESIRTEDFHFPKTSLICLENTHNRHGGTIITKEYINELTEIVKANGLKFHCDGARLWNACAETGISPKSYTEPFDTVSVCFSKGLGAPVGSAIASTKENIKAARKWRKILGGGMRQAGIIASAALYAVKNHFILLKDTHNNARLFAKNLKESEFVDIDLSKVETNIVIFNIDERIQPQQFEEECKKQGVQIIPIGKNKIRAVFHFQISEEDSIQSANIIKNILNKMIKK